MPLPYGKKSIIRASTLGLHASPGLAAAIIVAGAIVSSSANAAVITFETAPAGPGFTGSVNEDGFTYARLSGGLFVGNSGNPGQDMEGDFGTGGGVLDITSASAGSRFTFSGLDYAAFAASGTGSQTLTVTGLLGGSVVRTSAYTLANTATDTPKYANWTSESASGLAGVTIDDLRITLNAAGNSEGTSPLDASQNIDNVVLNAVPEPASFALLAAGLAGMGFICRRRGA